jgi:hypothetical protein
MPIPSDTAGIANEARRIAANIAKLSWNQKAPYQQKGRSDEGFIELGRSGSYIAFLAKLILLRCWSSSWRPFVRVALFLEVGSWIG